MQLDKKHMPEYVGTMEATIEIQSLQIVGFLSMVSACIIRITGSSFIEGWGSNIYEGGG